MESANLKKGGAGVGITKVGRGGKGRPCKRKPNRLSHHCHKEAVHSQRHCHMSMTEPLMKRPARLTPKPQSRRNLRPEAPNQRHPNRSGFVSGDTGAFTVSSDESRQTQRGRSVPLYANDSQTQLEPGNGEQQTPKCKHGNESVRMSEKHRASESGALVIPINARFLATTCFEVRSRGKMDWLQPVRSCSTYWLLTRNDALN